MKRSLLDVNVLLALLDELHQQHDTAMQWLTENIGSGWASCPITQNGFARIVSQPRYPRPVPIARALSLLADAAATKYHEFWPDDLTLLDSERVAPLRIHGPKQLTDVYLLALAVKHDGQFVTFDGSIPMSAARGADRNHRVVL